MQVFHCNGINKQPPRQAASELILRCVQVRTITASWATAPPSAGAPLWTWQAQPYSLTSQLAHTTRVPCTSVAPLRAGVRWGAGVLG